MSVRDKLFEVVEAAYIAPFTVKSDFARKNAEYVAAAASKHLISTQFDKNTFHRVWRVTAKGLRYINEENT